MQGRRFDVFKACKDYQSWVNAEHSCLLILSGYNNRSILCSDQCWLSPVAIAIIQSLKICANHPIYTYYVFPPKGDLFYQTLSVILLQLLRQKSKVLRNNSQCDEFRAELYELKKYEKQDKNVIDAEGKRLDAFRKVALRVISFFDESETVHIIVDRADFCCLFKETLDEDCHFKKRIDDRKLLLKELVGLVEAARCKLKVLVVISGYQWSMEKYQDELDQKTQGRVIVHTAEQGYVA